MKAWIAMLASALMAASCAAGRLPDQREGLARQIADDAAAFNEAYAQAVSAQILLNVLRSRDRLPRYYLAMTGISDSPSWRYRQNVGVGSIPLGEGASPWGFGAAGLERETLTRPSYAVQPFSADTLTRAAFEPTAPYVFEHYWRSGWPRDILVLVMVEAIERTGADGRVHAFSNEANTIFDNCATHVETTGCAFVREARTFLAAVATHAPASFDLTRGRAACGLVEAYGPVSPVRPAPEREGVECDPAFVVGADTLRLRMRSLDDMIYYIGELMRAGSMRASPGGPIEAQVTVAAAGLRGGGRGVPLFRLLPRAQAPRALYAAEVEYAGTRYVAGPAIGRSCAEAAPDGPCRDDAEHGDRSSSVLSLIAEILALNQSPDAIRAPSRLIAE
jgi:hypothetical protein